MKPMLLTKALQLPKSDDWLYEIKYDGYRCILKWENELPTLISRNNQELNNYYPEILEFCRGIYNIISPYLPLVFDGEIVYLTNNFKSEFSVVQSRGKIRSKKTIQDNSSKYPCNFVVFDLLQFKGENQTQIPLEQRRQLLEELFQIASLPIQVDFTKKRQIQLIEQFESEEVVWKIARNHTAEGVVAKKKTSFWENGKRSPLWIKVKNWRIVTVILTKFEETNGYFNGAVYLGDVLQEVTTFQHGLSDDEVKTLSHFFKENGQQISSSTWEIPPSICVDVACIDFDGKKLREPNFYAFQFNVNPTDVNWKHMLRQLTPLPEMIQLTHPNKPIWPKLNLVKDDYILYLQQIAPYFLPFLKNRLLTAIRYPHGVPGESFYQKNAPDYTPSFIETKIADEIEYIICQDIPSLLWLGNQLALEFHIPFQTIDTTYPTEIVFDLDPPSVDEFSLAIEAALRMKAIFDSFQLQSYVKTSGGKGLQLYIPLPKDTFSYEDTHIFTEFICRFLVEQEPKWFTMERLKRNRQHKLYLDYVQHAEGKTIIAPYSPRGNELSLIATPLFWHEVKGSLHPTLFSIPTVLERIKTLGDPFIDFFKVGEQQNLEPIITNLKELSKRQ